MKTRNFLAAIMLLLCVTQLRAYDFQSGELFYNILRDRTNEVEVTWKIYSNYLYNSNWDISSADIPQTVEFNGTTYRVTQIGDNAFNNCKKLTSVTIPNYYVTSIGNGAFGGCKSLTEIIIPSCVTSIGNSAFSSCSGLTAITIPNSVTSIGDKAFSGCSGLTEFTIPNNLTSIGEKTFYYCSGLTSITIPNSVTSIGIYAFNYCNGLTEITIGNSVASIGKGAFASCSGLTEIILPQSLTYLGEGAFSGCSALQSMIIPDGVTNLIGNATFSDCKSLTSVVIGDGVTGIGDQFFWNCSALTSLTIGKSLTFVGTDAFYNCGSLKSVVWNAKRCNNASFNPVCVTVRVTDSVVFGDEVEIIPDNICSGLYNLTSIVIPESVTHIGSNAFYGCRNITSINLPNSLTSIGNAAFMGCTSLSGEIIVPNNVTSIGNYAFANCKGLTSIKLSENLTSIGNNTFAYCSGLTEFTIPGSVTSIGYQAFRNCTGLTELTIPANVTSMGAEVFFDCTGITSLTCEAVVPPVLDGQAFTRFNQSIPLYVPAEGVDAYRTTDQWKNFIITCGLGAGNCGAEGENLTWELDCDGRLIISGTGMMENYYRDQPAPWHIFADKIQLVELANEIISIGSNAFADCVNISELVVPGSVESIGESAFEGCENLSSIDFMNNHTIIAIEPSVFYGCTSLASIEISNTVTSIGAIAFAECRSLNSIVIPGSVESIGTSAFSNCTGLTSIRCEAVTPPILVTYSIPEVFENVDKSIPLYVPVEGLSAYKSADEWKDFTNIIPYDAHWVSFLDWDGAELSSDWVKDGTAAIAPVPSREGYTFIGWDKEFDNVTEDMSITAQYEINHYQVDFADWDGTILKSDLVEYLSAATPPADPELEGHTFAGWDKEFDVITEDIVITALYDPIYYPVLFFNYDGTLLSEQSVAYNTAASEPVLEERTGYIFSGWTADIEHIKGRTFAFALYEKEGIIVTYKSEDGDVIASEKADIHLPDAPNISGKSFAGWLTENADVVNGITLRATYTIDNPTTNEDVVVVPGITTANVSFPYITGAMSYVLVIRNLFGYVVCKIMFNSTGHLLGIALAPGRNRTQQQAQTNGFQFTVEGLDASTSYEYEFSAYDETDGEIEILTGSFTTKADVPTNAEANSLSADSNVRKVIEDGQVMIVVPEGSRYNAEGKKQ